MCRVAVDWCVEGDRDENSDDDERVDAEGSPDVEVEYKGLALKRPHEHE